MWLKKMSEESDQKNTNSKTTNKSPDSIRNLHPKINNQLSLQNLKKLTKEALLSATNSPDDVYTYLFI